MILFTGDRRLNKLEEDVNKLLDITSGLAAQKNNITELKTKVTGLNNDYTDLISPTPQKTVQFFFISFLQTHTLFPHADLRSSEKYVHFGKMLQ